MTYTINKSDGTLLTNLADQTANTSSSSLTLIGKGLLNYGQYEAQNFIYLLENFAKTTAPANPMTGQFWYDKATSKMKVWNGTQWVRAMLGADDSNIIPGLTFGAGLTVASGTLTANVRSVAGRTGDVTLAIADVAGGAPLASPALTGTPTAPTASAGTNSTQVATTAYVRSQITADTINYTLGNGLTAPSNVLAVVGTTNRVTVSGAGVDIASTYAGQNSISTLGNVTSGQWNATAVPVTAGGTGGTSASEARANLGVLAFNAVANSLSSVGNGILINNAGTATARSVVSGSPDKISITNGSGVGGDITISMVGDGNTGPVLISGGGTGATTKSAAFNALSPLTTTGDIIFYNSSAHDRLAGKTDGATYYLQSGAGTAAPRWASTIDASTLGGQNLAYVLNHANHTGTNDASLLNSQPGSYYLNRTNHTGNIPLSSVLTTGEAPSVSVLDGTGYMRFSNGLTYMWGRQTGYYTSHGPITVTFPVAFTTAFNATATIVISVLAKATNWFAQVGGLSPTQLTIYNNESGNTSNYSVGFYWNAVGYIA